MYARKNNSIASMYELKTIKLLIVWNNWDRLVKPTLAPLLAKSHSSNLRSGLASSLSTSSFPLLLYDLISSIFLPSVRLNNQTLWKNYITNSFRPNGNQNVTSACAQFTRNICNRAFGLCCVFIFVIRCTFFKI